MSGRCGGHQEGRRARVLEESETTKRTIEWSGEIIVRLECTIVFRRGPLMAPGPPLRCIVERGRGEPADYLGLFSFATAAQYLQTNWREEVSSMKENTCRNCSFLRRLHRQRERERERGNEERGEESPYRIHRPLILFSLSSIF
jgi:hypothetical protein